MNFYTVCMVLLVGGSPFFLMGCSDTTGVEVFSENNDQGTDIMMPIEESTSKIIDDTAGISLTGKIENNAASKPGEINNTLVDKLEDKQIPLLTLADFSDNYEGFDIIMVPSQIVATVLNDGPLGARSDDAFDYLAGFIFGDNTENNKIAMTSPVTRTQKAALQYETAFIMPSERTMDNLPSPNNDRITIKEIEPGLQAVRRFSGYIDEDDVSREKKAFLAALENENIAWYGLPTLAQYDGPWVNANARRNELWVNLNPQ